MVRLRVKASGAGQKAMEQVLGLGNLSLELDFAPSIGLREHEDFGTPYPQNKDYVEVVRDFNRV